MSRKKKDKIPWDVCPWVTRKSLNDPLTVRQRRFLNVAGVPDIKLELMTKCEASALIERIFQGAGYSECAAHRATLAVDRAATLWFDSDNFAWPQAWHTRRVFHVYRQIR